MAEGPSLRASRRAARASKVQLTDSRPSSQGFWARPQKIGDTLNLLQWDVGIPGKEGVSRLPTHWRATVG